MFETVRCYHLKNVNSRYNEKIDNERFCKNWARGDDKQSTKTAQSTVVVVVVVVRMSYEVDIAEECELQVHG